MLNRVMISELAFPALLVGGALAFEQLMAPARVVFGQISDRSTVWTAPHALHLAGHRWILRAINAVDPRGVLHSSRPRQW